jgi:hypothetical protein
MFQLIRLLLPSLWGIRCCLAFLTELYDLMLISGADMGSSVAAAVALLPQVLPDLLTELDGMDQRQRLLSLVQVRAPRVSLVRTHCFGDCHPAICQHMSQSLHLPQKCTRCMHLCCWHQNMPGNTHNGMSRR